MATAGARPATLRRAQSGERPVSASVAAERGPNRSRVALALADRSRARRRCCDDARVGVERANRAQHERGPVCYASGCKKAASAITGVIPSIETPLASIGGGGRSDQRRVGASFQQVIGPLVGPDRTFASASIWPVAEHRSPQPLVIIGERPELEAAGAAVHTRATGHAVRAPQLTVVGIFDSSSPVSRTPSPPRTGTSGTSRTRNRALPKNQSRSVIQQNAAFAELGYALYLGSSEKPQALLASSNVEHLPILGRRVGSDRRVR